MKAPKKPAAGHQTTLAVTPRMREQVRKIQEALDAPSFAAVMRNSLGLLQTLLNNTDDKGMVTIQKPDGEIVKVVII